MDSQASGMRLAKVGKAGEECERQQEVWEGKERSRSQLTPEQSASQGRQASMQSDVRL